MSPHTAFGTRSFCPEEREAIRELLRQKLGKEHLATRPGAGGTTFTYIESWKGIELANRIFGFNGWASSVVDITPDYIEKTSKGRFSVGVTAVVKVMLKDGTYHEDVGYGMSEHPSKGSAIENAKKEAVSDARKRALRVFGNALGNCIYNKDHLKRLRTIRPGTKGYLPKNVVNPYQQMVSRQLKLEWHDDDAHSKSSSGLSTRPPPPPASKGPPPPSTFSAPGHPPTPVAPHNQPPSVRVAIPGGTITPLSAAHHHRKQQHGGGGAPSRDVPATLSRAPAGPPSSSPPMIGCSPSSSSGAIGPHATARAVEIARKPSPPSTISPPAAPATTIQPRAPAPMSNRRPPRPALQATHPRAATLLSKTPRHIAPPPAVVTSKRPLPSSHSKGTLASAPPPSEHLAAAHPKKRKVLLHHHPAASTVAMSTTTTEMKH